jgi:hypothetical protein
MHSRLAGRFGTRSHHADEKQECTLGLHGSCRMNTNMNGTKLDKGEDPSKLFEAINAIDNQYKGLAHKLTEDDKIVVVLAKGKKEYSMILANTAQEKGTGLTMDDLENAMQIQ